MNLFGTGLLQVLENRITNDKVNSFIPCLKHVIDSVASAYQHLLLLYVRLIFGKSNEMFPNSDSLLIFFGFFNFSYFLLLHQFSLNTLIFLLNSVI
jgi:hypothetical protein